ncbi:polysaccharide deacetylase family protein [Sinorhizobium meliloti]|uniref:polysaccharide deacetylase family protein n=1 Tax=Rhizobium meliloti TaxID=382 RepID=UPI00207487D2|nr:polysaccharide deacetylase family protein [Sinorhizobium meliloti]MCM5693038.1 polysaccharide deacetylase family protein [Sinorhizobium meliloti]
MNRVDPRWSSSPGWPLVLYFHHVTDEFEHYTAIGKDAFRHIIELCLRLYGGPLDPNELEGVIERRGTAEPTFLVTFDDGYRNVVDNGLPVLDEFGIKAVFFIIYNAISFGACKGMPSNRASFLTLKDVALLRDGGHRLGGHTANHFDLSDMEPTVAEAEILPPQQLAQLMDPRSFIFAYPFGQLPKDVQLGSETFAFGTVKSAPKPWISAPHAIRRTYFPIGESGEWSAIVKGWREQWYQPSR